MEFNLISREDNIGKSDEANDVSYCLKQGKFV